MANVFAGPRALILIAITSGTLGGCAVDLEGQTPALVAGDCFQAYARTIPHGTSPDYVKLSVVHKRASDSVASAAQDCEVHSNAQDHMATVVLPEGDSLAPFDVVVLTWRVYYWSLALPTSRAIVEQVNIDPAFHVAVGLDRITAGETTTGVVSIGQPRGVDTPVTIGVSDNPWNADVQLNPINLVIPAGSTTASFNVMTRNEAPDPRATELAEGGPRSCEVTARIHLRDIGDFQASDRFDVVSPQ